MSDCFICERITEIQNNKNIFFVTELETGFVVLGDNQFYHGYTLFLSKVHARELHEVDKKFRNQFLLEMADVAEAVYKAFKPEKLNYELLGNTDEHMHWHIFPRRATDPLPNTGVWAVSKEVRKAPNTIPSESELIDMRSKLLQYL